ncbi:MAG: hypothetical protein IJ193_03005 [Bacilli bacterium]|nr:hypothetical protein [Bacilli bacterium]
MICEERLQLLKDYLKVKDIPILVEDLPASVFPDAVVLDADCDISNFNGHYEGVDFVPPVWYQELLIKKMPILVISNINMVSFAQQNHFIELLKYRKISTFDLPKNTYLILTCQNLKEHRISPDIYSYVAHI